MKIYQVKKVKALETYANQYCMKLPTNQLFPKTVVFDWDDLHGKKLEIIVSKSEDGVMVSGKSEDGHLYILKYENKI